MEVQYQGCQRTLPVLIVKGPGTSDLIDALHYVWLNPDWICQGVLTEYAKVF